MSPPPQHASTRSLDGWLGPGGGRAWLVAGVAAAVVLLDQATKLLASELLAGEGRVEVLGGVVELQLYRNFAGPNDILPGHTELFSIVSIAAALALAAIALRVRSTLSALVVGLLLGGAVGNLLDRLLREPAPLHGGVVDWFGLLGLTNLMNVADVAIHLAILVLLVAALIGAWPGGDQATGGPDERRAE